MKNLPVPSGAEDEKLCKVVVDGSVAFGGESQVSIITSEIFLSSVYWIAKKVSQGTSDTSTGRFRTCHLQIWRLERRFVFL